MLDESNRKDLLKDRNKIPMIKLCNHLNKRKVFISHNLKYWYCPDCKTDVGDL